MYPYLKISRIEFDAFGEKKKNAYSSSFPLLRFTHGQFSKVIFPVEQGTV